MSSPLATLAWIFPDCPTISATVCAPSLRPRKAFWDDGGKKVRNISIRDNILGGSPDTMGFYPAGEFYPYSQISWMEKVLSCIQKREKQDTRQPQNRRIFVGRHAPPANLSKAKRKQAEKQLGPVSRRMQVPNGRLKFCTAGSASK